MRTRTWRLTTFSAACAAKGQMSNGLNRTLLEPKRPASEMDVDKAEGEYNPKYSFPHPMLSFLANPILADLGMLIMRIVTAVLIVHHGLDKLQNTDGFSNGVIAVYFPFLPGSPYFWTYLSAGFEIAGSFCLLVGLVVRPAALLLAGTMVNAIAFHLMKFGLQKFPFNPENRGAYTYEPALTFLGVTACIVVVGPGRFVLSSYPKLEILNNLGRSLADVGVLFLRVLIAVLIFHHGQDKLQNTEGFTNGIIATFFVFLPGPPVFWTYLAASFEIIGSFCLIIGFLARPAAALLAGTMMNAIAFHLMNFGRQNFPLDPDNGGAYTFEPALAFLGITAFIALAGPGKFALKPNGF